MSVIIAMANQKGGVGKTTTAVNLGADLAARSIPVLVIDLDPQGNATSALGVEVEDGPMVYDVLLGEAAIKDAVARTRQETLWLLPANPDLAGAEVELVPAMAREYRLKRALEEGAAPYEFVIIDCPPSLGLLTINALTAASEALVPVQCEYLALEGLTQLMRTLEAVRRNLNPTLHLGGLLLTMFDSRTNLCQQVASEVRGHFPNTFQAVIPRSVRVSEAPSHGLPIALYAASSPAAKAYHAFGTEVLRAFAPNLLKTEAKA